MLLLGSIIGLRADAAEPAIKVSGAWSLETVPSAKVGGGFLTLTNAGKVADRLVRVDSEASNSVEIHEMHLVRGIMMMRQHAAGITVKPGARMVLKPFSHHLMFIDLKAPLVRSQTIRATLHFEQAGAIEVQLQVQPPGSKGPAVLPANKATTPN